jgi:membrane peptidoglycan carboxypeptidase
LGFPFQRLVPSYATAIGSSSDRPAALAELMGIIVNDGVRRPTLRLTQLRFAAGTPYETVFAPAAARGERVMEPAVARALRGVLAGVVSSGTARRVAGAFERHGKPIVVGGKTGSGDNRFKTFAPGGGLISARPVNRTATFVFYLSDRYYGVLTAFVPGREAGGYTFTSALPLSVLKLAAPIVNPHL